MARLDEPNFDLFTAFKLDFLNDEQQSTPNQIIPWRILLAFCVVALMKLALAFCTLAKMTKRFKRNNKPLIHFIHCSHSPPAKNGARLVKYPSVLSRKTSNTLCMFLHYFLLFCKLFTFV